MSECLHAHSPLFHLGGYGGYGGGLDGGFYPGAGQKAAKRGTADGRKCLDRNATSVSRKGSDDTS